MQSPTDTKPPEGITATPQGAANASLLLRQVRRIVVFILGISVVLVGIVMIVTPGPAVVVIPLGLAILATEFRWARKWLATARQWVRGRFQKIRLKKAN